MTISTALITGSETFGDYIFNPTKWLALTARGKIINDHKIHTMVLPAIVLDQKNAPDSGEIIVKKAIELDAKAIISFGMASDVKGFRIERSATNWIENEKYCSEYENKQRIDEGRLAREQVQVDLSRWNLEKMEKEFKKQKLQFESKISDDPGNFSCNGWIYRTVRAMKKYNLKIPYLFVHVSCTKETIEFVPDFSPKKMLIKKEDLMRGLEVILKWYR